MDVLIFWVALLGTVAVLAYHRASLTMFTAVIAALLAAATFTDTVGAVSWILFLVVALPLNLASIRQQYLTKPLLKLYRKIMPEMSTTEKRSH